MRRLRLDRPFSPGATLARDVTGPAGEVIARAGHALTERTVRALQGRSVSWCLVEDLWGERLPVVPLGGGHSTVRPLLRDFEQRVIELVAPLLTLSTQRALEVLRKTHNTAPLARSRFMDELPSAVRTFIDACAEATTVGGYLVDRVAAEDELGHAVGVAALTSRIATLVGLDEQERTAATAAALFHDIGMVFVPRTIRSTPPDRRSIPERIRYEDHAILGEAVLEPLGTPYLHLSIVAGEHHEAADGSGYPRKRVGGHRVLRTAEEKRDVDRVTLLSEIVAVADAYVRAVSPGPGVPGRSPASVRAVLESLAGRTLNREIVQRLLASFPVLPVGTEVRMGQGPHAGMQGIVCAVPPGQEEHPVVRLFLDAAGRPVEPLEVALAEERTATIELLEAA